MPRSQAETPLLPHQTGLWAYYQGRFLVLAIEAHNKKMDHVTWFRELGLPDFGLEFDRILRGRMIWDQDEAHYTLTFYDTMCLPNHVYQKIVSLFNPGGAPVIEKPIRTDWA